MGTHKDITEIMSPEDFAAALETVLDDPKLRQQFLEATNEYVPGNAAVEIALEYETNATFRDGLNQWSWEQQPSTTSRPCEEGKRTARMDVIGADQCGRLTDCIRVTAFGETRAMCPAHGGTLPERPVDAWGRRPVSDRADDEASKAETPPLRFDMDKVHSIWYKGKRARILTVYLHPGAGEIGVRRMYGTLSKAIPDDYWAKQGSWDALVRLIGSVGGREDWLHCQNFEEVQGKAETFAKSAKKAGFACLKPITLNDEPIHVT